MPASIALRKPGLRLSDPAESQRPLTFYAQILRRHWVTIALLSTAVRKASEMLCTASHCCSPMPTSSATPTMPRLPI